MKRFAAGWAAVLTLAFFATGVRADDAPSDAKPKAKKQAQKEPAESAAVDRGVVLIALSEPQEESQEEPHSDDSAAPAQAPEDVTQRRHTGNEAGVYSDSGAPLAAVPDADDLQRQGSARSKVRAVYDAANRVGRRSAGSMIQVRVQQQQQMPAPSQQRRTFGSSHR